jgi:predicted aspartyl protease
MGNEKEVRIKAVLANPLNHDLNCTLNFCVDTGATITVIPKRVSKRLRLKIVGKVKSKIAGDKIIENDLAYVYLYLTGEGLMTYAAITEGSEALLGCDVMEILQFQIDIARKKVLKPVRRFKVVSMFLKVTGRRLSEILSKKH